MKKKSYNFLSITEITWVDIISKDEKKDEKFFRNIISNE